MRFAGGVLLVALCVMLAAGCSGDGGDGPEAMATPTRTEYPLTVTDMLGREVTIPAAPERIAALSQTTIDYVYALGATSVLRPSNVNEPVQVQGLPVADREPGLFVGARIAEENPDLIVLVRSQSALVADMESVGAPVVVVGAETFADVPAAMRLLGAVVDQRARGEAAADALESKLASIVGELPDAKPRVLAFIAAGNPDELFAATGDSFFGSLIDAVGASNLAVGATAENESAGFVPLDPRTVDLLAPSVILIVSGREPQAAMLIRDALAGDVRFANVPAVRDGRLFVLGDLAFRSPGPRVGEALDVLSKLLYPEIFGD